MMPGMDPRKMEQMMRQMGIKSRTLPAKRVVIEMEDGNYIVTKPDVVEIDMKGQRSLQINGEMSFEQSFSADDVKLVVEQAGVSEQEAKAALKKAGGDIAEAIVFLKQEKEK